MKKPEDNASEVTSDEALDLLDGLENETDSEEDGSEDVDLRDDDEPDSDEEDDDAEASDEELDEDEDEDEPEPAKHGKGRAKKRIDQLTRKANDARREAEYERRQRERIEQDYRQLTEYIQQLQPTREQVEYGRQQGYSEQDVTKLIREEAAAIADDTRKASVASALRERLESNGARDALERLGNQKLTPFEWECVEALSEAKYPAEVAKAIASNEDIFSRFASLPSAVARARFIDRLDGRFESRKSATGKKAQPKPSPKVRGTTRAPEKNPDDMSQAEFEAWSRKQGLL